MPRIGIFICECGSNIKDKVNIPLVTQALQDQKDVVLVEPYRLLCSPDGRSYLEERIRSQRLTHVVIAACSPRDHQLTFMTVCERAGLNPYMMQLVNIREHCAWVTESSESATEKATRMIRAAVKRVGYHNPLSRREIAMNPDILVLGGGVAGIEACANLIAPRRKVYLVEKGEGLGGRAPSLLRTHPQEDRLRERLEEKMADLLEDKGIEVLLNHQMEKVVGYYGNFVVTLRPTVGPGEARNVNVGAIILTIGARTFDLSAMPEYGQGKVEGVLTSLEMEGRLSLEGLPLVNGAPPCTIGVVHCAGREVKGYCSKICCQHGLELSNRIMREFPDVQVSHFYSDLCIPGKSVQRLYEETLALGVEMVRSTNVRISEGSKKPTISYLDEEGKTQHKKMDMVLLLPAIEANPDAKELAEMVGITLDQDGFFSRKHEKLAAMSSDLEGIFIAGCSEGPKGIMESMVQAQAAAGAVLASLVPGKRMEVEAKTSYIEEAICQGCKMCLSVCPFGAITFDLSRKVAVVNEVMCRGCGNCVAACPSGAASVKHFTYNQLYEEIMEALR